MNKIKQNETDFKQNVKEEEEAEKTAKTKLIYGWQSYIYGKFLLEYVIKLLKYNEFCEWYMHVV